MSMRKLLSVKVHIDPDGGADLSHYGEFTSSTNLAIPRAQPGRNEHKYFRPNWENYEGETLESKFKCVLQDMQRMESYGDQWSMVGVWAEAEHCPEGGGLTQRTRSGGLWGIESDSDKSYFEEVVREQLEELRDELTAAGVDLAEFEELASECEYYTKPKES